MAVDIGPEGFGYRARPVDVGDAASILELRKDPELGRYLNPTAGGLVEQEQWIKCQRTREGDYYFVIESSYGNWEGVVGLYGISEGDGEWGRWILRRGSLASPASVLLILSFGFNSLGLRRVYCRTLAANTSVVRFHDACEYSCRTKITEPDGRHFVEHALHREDWSDFRSGLVPVAERVARRGDRS